MVKASVLKALHTLRVPRVRASGLSQDERRFELGSSPIAGRRHESISRTTQKPSLHLITAGVILLGRGCGLQTRRSLAGQWFDSTSTATRARECMVRRNTAATRSFSEEMMVTGLDTSLYSLVAEHPLTCNEKVRGSTPRGGFYSVCSQRTTVDATRTGIAQSVERGPFKPVVVGSSPTFGDPQRAMSVPAYVAKWPSGLRRWF